jgi:hypothetical protein
MLLTEMSTRDKKMLLRSKARPARKADNTDICEPIVYMTCDPQHLTTP